MIPALTMERAASMFARLRVSVPQVVPSGALSVSSSCSTAASAVGGRVLAPTRRPQPVGLATR